ncbi:hypothetical protein M5D96_009657 [Drosophila gunungcola]|uniref:Uncharacterized protein n=1 Tax=Drosophila gunungcola TaxID=103775 RepID=A0A9Q0BMY7_9MUSC|nr:hypothetical protein M5D96_009657 [Drosophila gunungcola]
MRDLCVCGKFSKSFLSSDIGSMTERAGNCLQLLVVELHHRHHHHHRVRRHRRLTL